jgi:hypothetical protein
VNGLIFWIVFEIDFGKGAFTKNVARTLWQSFESATIAGFLAYLALNLSEPMIDQTKVLSVFFHGMIGGVVGIVSWAGVLFLIKNEEVIEVWGSFKKRLPFKKVVVATTKNNEVGTDANLIVSDSMISESDTATH